MAWGTFGASPGAPPNPGFAGASSREAGGIRRARRLAVLGTAAGLASGLGIQRRAAHAKMGPGGTGGGTGSGGQGKRPALGASDRMCGDTAFPFGQKDCGFAIWDQGDPPDILFSKTLDRSPWDFLGGDLAGTRIVARNALGKLPDTPAEPPPGGGLPGAGQRVLEPSRACFELR